ncbi:hypothetical protein [Methylobacter sp.]
MKPARSVAGLALPQDNQPEPQAGKSPGSVAAGVKTYWCQLD